MDFPSAFNAFEVAWWLLLSVVCLWRGRGDWKWVGRTAVALLLLFAVSDVIELQTGAWWRPWWLVVLKGFCIIGLMACGVWALLISRRPEMTNRRNRR